MCSSILATSLSVSLAELGEGDDALLREDPWLPTGPMPLIRRSRSSGSPFGALNKGAASSLGAFAFSSCGAASALASFWWPWASFGAASAFASAANLSLGFRLYSGLLGGLGATQQDLGDPHGGQKLAMADLAARILPAALLESDDGCGSCPARRLRR